MADFAVNDMPSCFRHFEPVHVRQAFRRPLQRIAHRVVAADRRGTHDFDFLVDMIAHVKHSYCAPVGVNDVLTR